MDAVVGGDRRRDADAGQERAERPEEAERKLPRSLLLCFIVTLTKTFTQDEKRTKVQIQQRLKRLSRKRRTDVRLSLKSEGVWSTQREAAVR